ncbi:MAG: ribose 5-phosphate isomerase B [Lachnospirales bacterium]
MIGIGSDHGGFELKQHIITYLRDNNIEFKDYGCYNEDSTDYPIYGKSVCKAILNGECDKGILICGTGVGISIVANKFEGIRAALCTNSFMAKATREHNDANVLVLGGRVTGRGVAVEIVDVFLNTDFSNDTRHINRISQMEK